MATEPEPTLALVVVEAPAFPAVPVGPLEVNPAAVHLAAQTERARPGVLSSLRVAVRVLTHGELDDPLCFPWPLLRFQHLQAVLRALAEDDRKPAAVNHIRNAVLGVMRAAWRLEQIDDGQWLRLKDVRPIRGSSLPAGREVQGGEIDALIRVCADDPTPAGARDKALLAVLFGGGLRRSEVARLALSDYEVEDVRLRVQGKGRKERYVPLAAGAAECLADWLLVRCSEPGPLFVPINKAGAMTIRPLTSQAIYNACRKRALEAGVAAFAPHDARRTLASNALDASGDIVAVSGLLGHSSPSTTAKYDRRGERAKQRLASQLHVPYHRQARE